MKITGNMETRQRQPGEISDRLKNQDGASLMAALLFFVFCGVGASIILASASSSAGKIQNLPREDQKRYSVDSAAAFLRDELQRTENTVKIKEVIVEDSREEEEDTDDFYCYYVGSGKHLNTEESWQKFYGTDGGSLSSLDGGILDSLIVDIYERNYYQGQADNGDDPSGIEREDGAGAETGNDTSGEETEWTSFTFSVRQSGSGTAEIAPLKTSVRLKMADNYKITAILSDMVTEEERPEERCERRLVLEPFMSQKRTVKVEVFEEDSGEDEDGDEDSYTITTTTILTTLNWQNGTIEKELLEQDETE